MRPHYSSAAKALSLGELAQQCDIESAERRFWSKVDRRGPDECWLWQGSRMPSGHGTFNLRGTRWLAHRLAYTWAMGTIPSGMVVRHLCSQSRCVNPGHLAIGTQADNVRDMLASRGHWRMAGKQPARSWRRPVSTVEQRFWAKVEKTSDCWLWTGAKYSNGYGHFIVKGRNCLAHRLSYELAHGAGTIPPGMKVLHTCPGGDRKDCVNPAHLRIGTSTQNLADAIARGFKPFDGIRPSAVARGERSARAIITEELVHAIRLRAATTGESGRQIACFFGLPRGCVRDVIIGRTWKHVPLGPGEKLGFRRRVGADHHQAALSDDQRRSVVVRFLQGGVTQGELARALGVSRSVVGKTLLAAGVRVGRGRRNPKR